MNTKELNKHIEAIQKETARIEKKYVNKTVIADFYQLMRENKNFSPDHKKLEQEKQPVEVSHLVQINSNWAQNGKLYVIDEDATEEWFEKLEDHREGLKEKDKLEKAAGEALKGALKGVAGAPAPAAKKVEKPKVFYVGIDSEVSELDEAVTKPEDCKFIGTEKECKIFVVEEKERKAASQTHAVNEKLELITLTKKIKANSKPGDFSFVGTQDECDAFIEEHKPE